jgi:hypothetical protein
MDGRTNPEELSSQFRKQSNKFTQTGRDWHCLLAHTTPIPHATRCASVIARRRTHHHSPRKRAILTITSTVMLEREGKLNTHITLHSITCLRGDGPAVELRRRSNRAPRRRSVRCGVPGRSTRAEVGGRGRARTQPRGCGCRGTRHLFWGQAKGSCRLVCRWETGKRRGAAAAGRNFWEPGRNW